jgi:potassium/hydrogen antiporter
VNALLLGGALLVLLAVGSNRFSARVGVPVLVIFIGIGMLAGSEGIGGVDFENYALASGLGTVALVFILFDGGLRTSTSALSAAWQPAFGLATVGVGITAVLTGVAASWILGVSWLEGLLLGSIVGSTDAAAVFAVLRGKGTRLTRRLGSTLEVESGSNDPMAVFLTLGLLDVLLGTRSAGLGLVMLFVVQMGVGLVVGAALGRLAVEMNRRIRLDAAGLYPVMMMAVAFLSYGLAATLGGSGFLSVYVTGIVLGNGAIIFKRGILLFSDGMAWLAQILMFTMLGMLSFPSRLLGVSGAGLAIAAVLIFVARPVAVASVLAPLRFSSSEIALIAWGGLRGAVPIVLATFPLLAGIPGGLALFDVVFFVVLVSALLQGWTLPLVARRLGLQRPAEPEPSVTLEIASLREVDGDIVEYSVGPRSKASDRSVRDLALPDGAVMAMIARGREIVPPRGSTRLSAGDHAFVVVRPEVRSLVDRVFADRGASSPDPIIELPLGGHARIRDIREFYGLDIDAPDDSTLADLVRTRTVPNDPSVDQVIHVGSVRFRVLETGSGGVELVMLEIMTESMGEAPE